MVDTTPPAITLNECFLSQFINTVFEDPGASAFDALDGEVAVSISGDEVDASSVGDYVLACQQPMLQVIRHKHSGR